jgi:hypothetical protein
MKRCSTPWRAATQAATAGAPIALGRVVAAGQVGHAGLAGQVGLRLGQLATQVDVGAGGDGSLERALGPTGAPGDTTQRPAVTRQQQRRAAQRLLHGLRQRRRAAGGAGRADETQVLVAEPCVGLQAQAQAQLRVVAQFGVGVQRQVVGEQVDVSRQQRATRCFSQPVRRPSWPRQNRPW